MDTPVLKKVVLKKKVEDSSNDKSKVVTKIKKAKVQKEITKPKKTIEKKPKTKKIYPKFGQTKDTPTESDPLRKFYTSLLSQNNKSEMAIKWCTEHGLMPKQEDNITFSISKLKISKK